MVWIKHFCSSFIYDSSYVVGKCESCLWKSDSTWCKYWNENPWLHTGSSCTLYMIHIKCKSFQYTVYINWQRYYILFCKIRSLIGIFAFLIDKWVTNKYLKNRLKCNLGILSSKCEFPLGWNIEQRRSVSGWHANWCLCFTFDSMQILLNSISFGRIPGQKNLASSSSLNTWHLVHWNSSWRRHERVIIRL